MPTKLGAAPRHSVKRGTVTCHFFSQHRMSALGYSLSGKTEDFTVWTPLVVIIQTGICYTIVFNIYIYF